MAGYIGNQPPIAATIPDGLKLDLGAAITSSTSLDDSMFTGAKLFSVSAAATLTVPAGLVGTEPATFHQTGADDVTFAAGAGVTIQSLDTKLSIAGQFGSVSLIPKGGDVYTLIGALK